MKMKEVSNYVLVVSPNASWREMVMDTFLHFGCSSLGARNMKQAEACAMQTSDESLLAIIVDGALTTPTMELFDELENASPVIVMSETCFEELPPAESKLGSVIVAQTTEFAKIVEYARQWHGLNQESVAA